MQPKLSIVIPVYNVSQYLKKCVLSCVNQNVDHDFFEIILVNDGSTDDSLNICKALIAEFPKLRLVDQENKGLSGARNSGLAVAKGDYIWFVDSDDWIATDGLIKIIDALKSDLDILWLGHDVWLNEKSIKTYLPQALPQPIVGDEFFKDHLNDLFYIWKFIYKKDFLMRNKLTFYEGLFYEDLEFTPRALKVAKQCATLPLVCYHYLVRPGSIANYIRDKNVAHRFYILNKLADLLDDNTTETYKTALIHVIIHTTENTYNMAARAGLKIPEDGATILKRIKSNNWKSHKVSTKFKLLKASPTLIYNLNTVLYKVYNLISSKSN